MPSSSFLLLLLRGSLRRGEPHGRCRHWLPRQRAGAASAARRPPPSCGRRKRGRDEGGELAGQVRAVCGAHGAAFPRQSLLCVTSERPGGRLGPLSGGQEATARRLPRDRALPGPGLPVGPAPPGGQQPGVGPCPSPDGRSPLHASCPCVPRPPFSPPLVTSAPGIKRTLSFKSITLINSGSAILNCSGRTQRPVKKQSSPGTFLIGGIRALALRPALPSARFARSGARRTPAKSLCAPEPFGKPVIRRLPGRGGRAPSVRPSRRLAAQAACCSPRGWRAAAGRWSPRQAGRGRVREGSGTASPRS